MDRNQKKPLRKQRVFLIAILLAVFLVPAGIVRAEVVLDYFVASEQAEGVLLEWETQSETDSNGFYIYRSTKSDVEFARLNIFFLSDSESGEGVFYSYLDDEVSPGFSYYYKLEAVDFNGSRTTYGPVSANFQVQKTRTPTATLGVGTANGTPSATQSALGTANATQRTPTPTLTPSGLVLLLPSSTGSLTMTPTQEGTVQPTKTPTLEPLPAFELLFPAPTITPVASPTALQLQITSEPNLAVESTPEPLSKRHIVLLAIIALLWVFLFVFFVFLVKNFFHHFHEADEVNG